MRILNKVNKVNNLKIGTISSPVPKYDHHYLDLSSKTKERVRFTVFLQQSSARLNLSSLSLERINCLLKLALVHFCLGGIPQDKRQTHPPSTESLMLLPCFEIYHKICPIGLEYSL